MLRRTCKILIGIGLLLIILDLTLEFWDKSSKGFLLFWGIILLIVSWRGWNSEERKNRKERLFEAQIEGLKKGKINVELKGKIRKLK